MCLEEWHRKASAHVLVCKAAPCLERGHASAPGARRAGGAPRAPWAAPRTCPLRIEGLLGHLADHVVEDAPVAEISELHVGVKPHDSLEGLPGVQL